MAKGAGAKASLRYAWRQNKLDASRLPKLRQPRRNSPRAPKVTFAFQSPSSPHCSCSEAEAAEEAKWSEGSKGKGGKKAVKEETAEQKLAAKNEKARLLAEEEAELERESKSKKAPVKKTKSAKVAPAAPKTIEEYSASGIDSALYVHLSTLIESRSRYMIREMLDLVTGKSDKATLGAKAGKIDVC
jgi:hypothetical protein